MKLRVPHRVMLAGLAALTAGTFLAPQAAQADILTITPPGPLVTAPPTLNPLNLPPLPPIVPTPLTACVDLPVVVAANPTVALSASVGGLVMATAQVSGTVSESTSEVAHVCAGVTGIAVVTLVSVTPVAGGVLVGLHAAAVMAPATVTLDVTLVGPVTGSLHDSVPVDTQAGADITIFA